VEMSCFLLGAQYSAIVVVTRKREHHEEKKCLRRGKLDQLCSHAVVFRSFRVGCDMPLPPKPFDGVHIGQFDPPLSLG
jgi:hypothetical protein